MTSPEACPDRATLERLLDDRLPAADRAALLAHLERCPTCAFREEIDAPWSLRSLATREPSDEVTRAALSEIGARVPAAAVTGLDQAAPPIPEIPGLVDLELVARGGMGIVYRAHDPALDRAVAVKVLARPWGIADDTRARAEREALLLARLDHANVVRILSAGCAEGLPYLVMEWVAGETLAARIERGTLPPREAARIGRDLARALEALHLLGIVHRDIKPENVLLAPGPAPGDPCTPKLADFGLARPEDPACHLTQSAMLLGTPSYMAPEQTGLDPLLGPVGPATDLHGLGGTLLAMLTGKPPYEGTTAADSLTRAATGATAPAHVAMPGVPLDLRTIVEKCLRREPGRRYASARDLTDDLDRFLAHRPIHARRPALVERVGKWARRRPLAAGATAAALAAGLAAVAGTVYHVVELERANVRITASRDLARGFLESLTESSGDRILASRPPLSTADRDYLLGILDRFLHWPIEPDAADGLRFRLLGIDRIGQILTQLRQDEDALECQRLVLGTIAEMDARGIGGDDVESRRLHAMTSERRLLGRLGRGAEAEEACRLAIARLATMPGRKVDVAKTTLELAASLAGRGEIDEGDRMLREGLSAMAAARAAAPDDPEILHAGQIALFNAAHLAFGAGHLDDMEAFIGEFRALSDAGMEKFPANRPLFAQVLLPGMAVEADIALRHGRVDEALAITRRRGALAAELATTIPDMAPVFLARQVDATIQAYELLAGLGRAGEAAADLDLAETIATRFYDAEPSVLGHTQLLVNVLSCRAGFLDQRGDVAGAVAVNRRIITLLVPWLGEQGEDVAALIVGVSRTVADQLSRQGDHAGAAAALDEALASAPEASKPDVLVRLARARQRCGNAEAAREAAHGALATGTAEAADEARRILADLAP